MEIRQVDFFLKVAENRSFSRAAESLHISQPALSRYIGELEKRLGVKLFQRTPKQVLLTYAGERYLSHALIVKEKIMELQEEMRAISTSQKKRIKVGMIRSGWQLSLSQSIEDFRKRYPDVTLHISEQLSRDLELGVLNGIYDIAFMSEPIRPQGLDFQFIEENNILLMVPKEHPLAACAKKREKLYYPWIDIHLFKNEEFVLQDESCRMRLDLEAFFAAEKFKPLIKMLTQSTVDTVHFAESGIGFAFLTDGYVRYITNPEKVHLFCVGDPVRTSCFGVISKKGAPLSPAMKDFINIYMQKK